MMDCRRVGELLDDHVDGELSEGLSRELQAHLAACAACAQSEAGLRALLHRAAGLPAEFEPSRDLWPGIEAGISGRRAEHVGRSGTHPLAWSAAAAAALILLLSAATVWVARGGPSPAGPRSAAPSEWASLAASEPDYLRARTQMIEALEARRGQLSPETLKVIEENLAVMDRSLAAMKKALEKDPGNRGLAVLIEEMYREEIRLLMRAANLPAHA
jgi:hypothetical protein